MATDLVAAEDDEGKLPTGSPDSIPSVAATSVSSSLYDSGENFAPRRLFISEDGSTAAIPMENLCVVSSGEGKEVAYGSEASFTSSETTVVASRNLSVLDSEEEGGYFPTIQSTGTPVRVDLPSNDTRSTPFDIFDAPRGQRSPEMVEEDPPEQVASCNGALSLTPRQLAEIFVAFQGGRKRWSSRSKETTEHTPDASPDADRSGGSPSSPRGELLLRECDALKKIIQNDSTTIVNLKRAMEAQREMMTLQGIENEDRDVELKIAQERIDALKKEKELMREREEELLQTIQILKIEVDKLSTVEAQKRDLTKKQTLIIEEDTDPDMADSDVDDHFLIAELRLKLAGKEEENVQLKAQVEFLQASPTSKSPQETREGVKAEATRMFSLATELAAVSVALQGISKRWEAVEQQTYLTESAALDELGRTGADCEEEMRATPERQRQSKDDLLKISQDPDEVEVLLPNGKNRKKEQHFPPSSCESACCCDAWSTITVE